MKNNQTTANRLRKIVGEPERQDVHVVMPKAFLTQVENVLKAQNDTIAKALADQNEKLASVLVDENTKTRDLFSALKEAIQESRVDRVEVANFPEQKPYPKSPNFRSILDEKPRWYEKFVPDRILEHIEQSSKYQAKQFAEALDRHTKKENAFAVRLVSKDGKTFYDALFQAFSAAVPSSITVAGTVAVNAKPATSGGLTIFRSIDLDETEEEVKSSTGQVYGWYLYNNAAATTYVKFYNATAASVVVGTTIPVLTIPVPAGSAANVEFTNGIAFSTAITVAATTGVADSDTGAPAANDLIANILYA